MNKKSALIVVDAQLDFMPGGSLPVNDGDKIVRVINDLLSEFDLVIFTQDWHPLNHKSFASQHPDKKTFDIIDLNGLNQVLWPDHCVQHTKGAEFHNDIKFINIRGDFYIIKKGTDPEVDSYSGFYDNGRKNSTGLTEFLNERNIENVFITGLAGDYCCEYTAIDAAMDGFNTYFILDAIRFINQDKSSTFKHLADANIKIIESWELPLFMLTN